MSVDNICKMYAKKRIKIKLTIENDMVIIEGKASAFEFLGNLFLAHSKGNSLDCGFQMSPFGAGKSYFESNSTNGLYLHRIPCTHKKPIKRR